MLYVSPLKALAVDVERNLRAPLAGIADRRARARRAVRDARRSPCAPATRRPRERARFQREPADILITTPESLYLLLTSQRARGAALGRHGHHRRDPRAGADQARRAPRAVARAARGADATRRCSASASRPRSVRSTRWRGFSAAHRCASRWRSVRADRARRRPPTAAAATRRRESAKRARGVRAPAAPSYRAGHDRRRRQPKALDAHSRGAGRGHGEVGTPGRRHPERSGGAGTACARRSGRHPPAPARADPRAPLDADLRQQPAARRAARRRAQRAGGRDARALAPRIDRARRSASRSRTR